MSYDAFDLQAKVGIDTSKFVEGVKNASKVNKDLKKELDSSTPHVKALEDRLDQATKAVNEAQKKVEDLSDAYNKSAKKAGYNAEETKKLNDELTKAEKELHKAENEVNGLKRELDKETASAKDGAKENKVLGNEVKTAGDKANEAKGKFLALGGAIKDGIEAAAKVGTVAIGAAATGIGALVNQSVQAMGEYEQLAGGVDKLFGEASGKVKQYADEAYATSGLSAIEYLQQVTGFSASLIQATGRGEQQDIDELKEALDEEYKLTKEALSDQYDEVKANWNERIKASKAAKDGEADMLTKQRDAELKALKKQNEEELNLLKAHHKDVVAETERANNQSETTFESLEKAADLANVAMKSISDNVNTFGTDMGSVQDAYQGFAKQNYQMLDNLRLGYGGNKGEMERLIDDANEYAESIGEASDLSIDSFADIVTAIDLIQRKQGIAGTTINEAAGTITGSLTAVKKAWQNLVLEMSKEDGDIGAKFEIFGANAGQFLTNIMPKIESAIGGVGDLIAAASPQVISGIQKLLPKVLPSLIKTAGSLVGTVGQGLLQATPAFLEMGKNALKSIADGLSAMDINPNDSVLAKILGVAVDNAPEYFGYAQTILANLGNALISIDHKALGENIGKVIVDGLNSITNLLVDLDMNQVGKNIGDFIGALPWKDIARSVMDLLGAALGSIGEIAGGFFEAMDGETFLNALAVIAAPKLLGGMLTAFKGQGCATEFGSIRDFLGAEIGKGGDSAGIGYMTAFEVGAKAFIAGWGLGTYIRENLEIGDKTVGEHVDESVEKSVGAAVYTALTSDWSDLDSNSFRYTNRYGKTAVGKISDGSGNYTEAYKQYLAAQEKGINTETVNYYADGKQQSFRKYDDFGNETLMYQQYKKSQKRAVGGVITRPTNIVAGENGAEAIVPLENNTGWIDKVAQRLGNSGGVHVEQVILNINGTFNANDPIERRQLVEEVSRELKNLQIVNNRAQGGAAW